MSDDGEPLAEVKVDWFGFDATPIWEYAGTGAALFQGSHPADHAAVLHRRFDALMLTACGHQALDAPFSPKLEVGRADLVDCQPMRFEDRDAAIEAAKWVAMRLRAGKRVLVTCQAGYNRSGLVCAIALHLLTGKRGAACMRRVQSRRPSALFRTSFQRFLIEGFPGSDW